MGRPRIAGVERPPCPLGHAGDILLDGHTRSAQGNYERTGIGHTGCPRCDAIAGKGVKKTPEDLSQIRAMREAVAIA
jgi:hypothetical protein